LAEKKQKGGILSAEEAVLEQVGIEELAWKKQYKEDKTAQINAIGESFGDFMGTIRWKHHRRSLCPHKIRIAANSTLYYSTYCYSLSVGHCQWR
jgi:hypothetical protein